MIKKNFLLPLLLLGASLLIALAISFTTLRFASALGLAICAPLYFFVFSLSTNKEKNIEKFIYFIGLIYLVSVLLWPRYGSLPFNFLPIRNPRRALFIILGVLTVVSFLISKKIRANFKLILKQEVFAFSMLALFVVWRFISIFNSNRFEFSILFLLAELMGGVAGVLIWSAVMNDREKLKSVINVIVITAYLSAILVIIEGLIGKNLYLSILNLNPSESDYIKFLFNRIRDGVYRAQGAFEHPLILTEFIIFIVPLFFYKILTSNGFFKKLLWINGLLLQFGAVYFAHSRSAFLFLAIVSFIGICFICARVLLKENSLKKWVLPIFLILIILVAVALLLPYATQMVLGNSSMERLSTSTRLLMLERGLPIIWDNLFIGIGPGNAGLSLGIFSTEGLPICDNIYLQFAIESGLPGLAFFVCFFCIVIYKSIHWALNAPASNDQKVFSALLIGVLGILLFKFVMAEQQNFEFLFLAVISMLIIRFPTSGKA